MDSPTILLLSGGKSTRFWPLPHKMLLPFLGIPFIEHQINFLKTAGCSDIVVVVSPEIATGIDGEGIAVETQQGEGQAAGILSARQYITDNPLLVLNADDIISPQLLSRLLEFSGRKNLLTGFHTTEYFPGGYLELVGKQVKRVVEKPGKDKTPSSYVRLVCDYFSRGADIINYLEKVPAKTKTDDRYEQALSAMMVAGEQFEMLPYAGTWLPVKYPWHTLAAMDYFLGTITASRIDSAAELHSTATITGSVIIESGVRVMEYAKLVGPLYIGKGTIIGNHSMLRSSMVGENSVIGFGSDVTRSYIGSNTWLHTNYVGDSILADNVGVGAGAVFANLRFDEKNINSMVKKERIDTGRNKLGVMIGENSRIGVGVHTMPGIKVGSNCVVGATVLLDHDIPDNTRVFTKQSHTVVKNQAPVSIDRTQFRKKI